LINLVSGGDWMVGGGIGISLWRRARVIVPCYRQHSIDLHHYEQTQLPCAYFSRVRTIYRCPSKSDSGSMYWRTVTQCRDRPILFIFMYKLTTSPLPRPKRPTRSSLSLLSSNLWFSPVKDLQEFSNSMPHSRVHVCFRALDVVM
jgi:hypothetical protein